LSANVNLAPAALDVDDVAAKLGDATLQGWFSWNGAASRDEGGRRLSVDLKADRFDLDQLQALGEVVFGESLAHTGDIAESFVVKLSASQLRAGHVDMSDVVVDATLTGDALDVKSLSVGD